MYHVGEAAWEGGSASVLSGEEKAISRNDIDPEVFGVIVVLGVAPIGGLLAFGYPRAALLVLGALAVCAATCGCSSTTRSMSAGFERFMADFLRRQGYAVEETKASGDQGVDLVLPDYDGKRVVVQLKRWTAPVGNAAVQATFAGMAHYRAEEG